MAKAKAKASAVMGWETFQEFHDCYLHTDVLALANVMESYRNSFRAQSGLDPIHYVTLRGAWNAMLGQEDFHLPYHRQAGLQGRAVLRHGWAKLHLPSWARRTKADLVLGRHVPGRSPCRKKRSKAKLAARDSSLNWKSDARR